MSKSDDMFVLGCFHGGKEQDPDNPCDNFTEEQLEKIDTFLTNSPLLNDHGVKVGKNIMTYYHKPTKTSLAVSVLDTSNKVGKLTAAQIKKHPQKTDGDPNFDAVAEIASRVAPLKDFSLGHLLDQVSDYEKKAVKVTKLPWEISLVEKGRRPGTRLWNCAYESEMNSNSENYIINNFLEKWKVRDQNTDYILKELNKAMNTLQSATPGEAPQTEAPNPNAAVPQLTKPADSNQATQNDEMSDDITAESLSSLDPKALAGFVLKATSRIRDLEKTIDQMSETTKLVEDKHKQEAKKLVEALIANLGHMDKSKLDMAKDFVEKQLEPSKDKSLHDLNQRLQAFQTLIEASNESKTAREENARLKEELAKMRGYSSHENQKKQQLDKVRDRLNATFSGPLRHENNRHNNTPYTKPVSFISDIPQSIPSPSSVSTMSGQSNYSIGDIPSETSHIGKQILRNESVAYEYASLQQGPGANVMNRMLQRWGVQ